MTSSNRIPWWHWAVLFSGFPLAGAALSFFLLVHGVQHPFATAAAVAGICAGLVDFARRDRPSAAVTGAVAGALVVPLASSLLLGLLVIACSTGGCGFD